MEMLEAKQQRMNVENLKKQDDNTRRLDILLSHMKSEKRLDAITWGRSRAALVYGNSPSERGDSSVSGNFRPVSSLVTPIFFMANRGCVRAFGGSPTVCESLKVQFCAGQSGIPGTCNNG
ncbi:uncharacterized protein LOC107870760 [Capsicum annuum]|uniref:uncharacterized protein LOC107870760 n=1 Tax=Capsicum annuum TaxID=4072 RepID=UPI001FB186A6|nr:uncharacterized protein LOC107870760 [Capsicum annuum]